LGAGGVPTRRATGASSVLALILACLLAWAIGPGSASAADQSVAYQLDVAHDGNLAGTPLTAPLTQAWSVTLPGEASYPLIVNGMVFVTANDGKLYALRQATGATLWSHDLGGTYASFTSAAYDRGQTFALNFDGLLRAFDPETGNVNWSAQLPSYFYDTAPAAVDGVVYVNGAGVVSAVRESDGHVLWTRPWSQDSSPAVAAQAVYIGGPCQDTTALARATGALRWVHPNPLCSGGGGHIPAVGDGIVFARNVVGDSLLLNPDDGAELGSFSSDSIPAISGGVAYLRSGSTLRAVAGSGQGATLWTFAGDGHLDTAPIVSGNLVFVGSSSGTVYALASDTGTVAWSDDVGTPLLPSETNVLSKGGFGAANGTLVVPAGTTVAAYRPAGAISAVPGNVDAPTLDGTAQVGQIVAVNVGSWSALPMSYAYQWQLCDGAGCSDIADATHATYTPSAANVGSAVRAVVTATNAVGDSSPVTTSASAQIVPPAPVNLTVPEITGQPIGGHDLTASPGTWTGSPTDYSYTWRRCSPSSPDTCSDIAGATAATYTVTTDDSGLTIRVHVTATNAGGDSDPAESAPTAPAVGGIPANVDPPDFSGDPVIGHTLFATPGNWTNSPDDFAYQWFACNPATLDCPDIPGATSSTYLVTPADAGRFIGVEVTASNLAGASDPADSDAFGPVVPDPPESVTDPAIAGVAQVGVPLMASPGTWTNSPTQFSYLWFRCQNASLDGCEPIDGATASSYTPTSVDSGRVLIATVVATNAGGDSDVAVSAPTAVVLPPASLLRPSNLTKPQVAGNPRVGTALIGLVGVWTNNPTDYTFEWMRCDSNGVDCQPITGAVARTYTPSADDLGHRLVVSVSASNSQGPAPPVDSGPSDPVSPPVPPPPPKPNSAFAILTTNVATTGSVTVRVSVVNPGTLTATATASSAALTGCRHRCRPATYGTGSRTTSGAGTITVVVRPSAAARRAIARHHKLRVTVKLTFRSALGAAATHSKTITVTAPRQPQRKAGRSPRLVRIR